MNNYTVFTRTWWKSNKNYPNGLEPHMGKRKVIRKGLSIEQARKECEQWNNNNPAGKYSRRAEFTNKY